MNAFGLARLGRDAELRTLPDGGAVARLSLAFTRRVKGEKVTDWVEGNLWGKRAEALTPHLLKGGLVSVTLEDLHINVFTKQDGTTSNSLTGRVVGIDLAGGGERQAPAPRPAPPPAPRPPAPPSAGFEDMDSDIPFISASPMFDMVPRKTRRMASYDY